MASNFPFRLPPPIVPGRVGIALIVSNNYCGTSKKFLGGTDKDARMMVDAFGYLGYQTILRQNISRQEFIAEYEKLAGYNYEPQCGCKRIAVVFSGHGTIDERESGLLILQDEKTVMVKDLVNSFKPADIGNPSLANTIRMFFIDACRGESEEDVVHVSRSPRGGEFVSRASSEAGILIAYSTTVNHKAYEGNEGGLWIQLLAREMCTLDEPLLSVLTKVNKKLNEQCSKKSNMPWQTAQHVSQLTDDVYFLKERPVRLSVSNSPPTMIQCDVTIPSSHTQPTLIVEPMDFNTTTQQDCQKHIRETLTSQGITCQYNFTETPSRQPGTTPSYSCELNCHSNGVNHVFRSKQSYHDRSDARRDVDQQAQANPKIGSNEIFSRSEEDHTSRVDKLADYCKSKGYRSPSYSTKPVTNGLYSSTVLVPRNGKFEGETAENISIAKEKAAKKALLELGVIKDSLQLL